MQHQDAARVRKMKARIITRNDIEKMGLPVYGFVNWDAPLGETDIDNYIGYNAGICGWNYDVYLNTFADGSKYIVVSAHWDALPKEWKENGCNLFVHQIQKGLVLLK